MRSFTLDCRDYLLVFLALGVLFNGKVAQVLGFAFLGDWNQLLAFVVEPRVTQDLLAWDQMLALQLVHCSFFQFWWRDLSHPWSMRRSLMSRRPSIGLHQSILNSRTKGQIPLPGFILGLRQWFGATGPNRHNMLHILRLIFITNLLGEGHLDLTLQLGKTSRW